MRFAFFPFFLLFLVTLQPPTLSQKSPDVRLDTDPPGAGYSGSPRIAATESGVFVAWDDDRNGARDIYFTFSSDRGATWLASDVRIETDPPGAAESIEPTIAASGNSVYVAWQDGRNGSDDIYFIRSLDGGGTWLSADL